MPRASHKKSRRGCAQCKRRHTKCDETQPRCVNCTTAKIHCSYEDESSSNSTARQDTIGSLARPQGRAFNSPAQTSQSSPTTPYTASSESEQTGLNLLHLELLYTWSSTTCHGLIVSRFEADEFNYGNTTIEHGLKNPFLLQQILATSALHISITRPARSKEYHQHAVQLQADALAGFNRIIDKLNESNILAAFLFSSLTGIHVFCDIFTYKKQDFSQVLDDLTGCISLLRGVRAVIGDWWEYMKTSDLRPILDRATDARHSAQPTTFPELRSLIDRADVGQASKTAYNEALVELELLFGVHTPADIETNPRSNSVLSWLVLVPRAYSDLLSERRPEALVFLAYYAVLLYQRRQFWPFAGSGEFLIRSIHTHLGSRWEDFLSWPMSKIQNHT